MGRWDEEEPDPAVVLFPSVDMVSMFGESKELDGDWPLLLLLLLLLALFGESVLAAPVAVADAGEDGIIRFWFGLFLCVDLYKNFKSNGTKIKRVCVQH